MNIEYIFHKLTIEDFKKDIHSEHLRRVTCQSTGVEYADRLTKEFKDKYNQTTDNYVHNRYVHQIKLCREWWSEYKK